MSRRGAPPGAAGGHLPYRSFPNGTAPRSTSVGGHSGRPVSRGNTFSTAPSSQQQQQQQQQQWGPPTTPQVAYAVPLQRKQSASGDVFAFAQSVLTPPGSTFMADRSQTAAGTPRLMQGVPQRSPAPFQPPPMSMQRTLSSGSTGYGSMYGGFGDTNTGISSNSNLAASNSFYGNMGSFYGGFGGPSGLGPSSRGGSFILPGPQDTQPVYGHSYTAPHVANQVGLYSRDDDEDAGDLLSRSTSTSSGRSLRRKVSFSGVPPVAEEAQRTVARTPKRVGTRRLLAQRSAGSEKNAARARGSYPHYPQQSQQQLPQQQEQYPEQQTTAMVNGNAGPLRGYGSGYMQNVPSAAPNTGQPNYPAYGAGGPSYGSPYRPAVNGYPPQRYNAYAGGTYATFTNGNPMMMMQQRPRMPGYFY